jgi:hypothetical protein
VLRCAAPCCPALRCAALRCAVLCCAQVVQAWLSLSDQGVAERDTRGLEGETGAAGGGQQPLRLGGWAVPYPALFAQLLVFALGGLGHLIGWCMLPPSARTMGEAGDENLSASLLGADAGSPPTTRFGSLQGKIRGGLGYLRSYLPDGSSGGGGANGYAYSEADLLASEEDAEHLPD